MPDTTRKPATSENRGETPSSMTLEALRETFQAMAIAGRDNDPDLDRRQDEALHALQVFNQQSCHKFQDMAREQIDRLLDLLPDADTDTRARYRDKIKAWERILVGTTLALSRSQAQRASDKPATDEAAA